MRRTLIFAAALLLSATAHAQLFRAYLSSTGNDANACTLPQPCRLLPAALAAAADGGEVWMLDSANYNTATVNVTKSVSILAVPGAFGSILAIGGPAISITAGSLKVALRNLVVAPLPSSGATDGVFMTGASSLTIEKSVIANLPFHGVYVVGGGNVKIAETTIRNNVGYAVRLENGPKAEITRTQMLGNAMGGVFAYASTTSNTTASVGDSVVSGGTVGVSTYTSDAGAVARIAVTRCTIENVDFALDSETGSGLGSAVVTVSNSVITNNINAWYLTGTGAVIRTLGNNHISDNTTSLGVLTSTALQ